jgi:hypothetical protein
MTMQNFSLTFGLLVWLVATLIFRYWGDRFFLIENNLLISFLFVATIPVLYILTTWVFKRYKLAGDALLKSSVLMVVPGMIGDVACLHFHTIVFPKFTLEQSIVLGAWILWAYVMVLIIGLVKSRS